MQTQQGAHNAFSNYTSRPHILGYRLFPETLFAHLRQQAHAFN